MRRDLFKSEAESTLREYLGIELPQSARNFNRRFGSFELSDEEADQLSKTILEFDEQRAWDRTKFKEQPVGARRKIPGQGWITAIVFVPDGPRWSAIVDGSPARVELVVKVNTDTNIARIYTTYHD